MRVYLNFRYTCEMSAEPKVLVTGSAGFIGSCLMRDLINSGITTQGIDNYSDYYNPSMKLMREAEFGLKGKTFNVDIADKEELTDFMRSYRPDFVVNLAAQGGVRASKVQPIPYLLGNQIGFLNLLELSRELKVQKFIFASSSSVYGDSTQPPFTENQQLSAPKSLYALSKLSNEIIAKYFKTQQMSIIGLRLFTVYGPWSRPDMAMFQMLASSRLNKHFNLTAALTVKRDFTYVGDVSKVTREMLFKELEGERFEIFNVCGGRPYSLQELFGILKNSYQEIQYIQMDQDELDVKLTHGSTEKLAKFGLSVPKTTLESGVLQTLDWFKSIPTNDISDWYQYSSIN